MEFVVSLSAPLRSNGADYVFFMLIFNFFKNIFIHRLFLETTRSISPNFQGLCILV